MNASATPPSGAAPRRGGGLHLTLRIWRQKGPQDAGSLKTYPIGGISTEMSFLEMLDILNEGLIKKGEEPVAFDHDCREGICGMCSLVIDGRPHGPDRAATTCQLHMRRFKSGDTVTVEPFRAKGFPVLKDLVVDRSSFDRIIQAGGYVSLNTGSAQDGNALPVPKPAAESAMDSAACIGCGACVAACPNASAMLFVGAKVSQLALLPQGQPERKRRALSMLSAADAEGRTATRRSARRSPKETKLSNIGGSTASSSSRRFFPRGYADRVGFLFLLRTDAIGSLRLTPAESPVKYIVEASPNAPTPPSRGVLPGRSSGVTSYIYADGQIQDTHHPGSPGIPRFACPGAGGLLG